jgi:hypothetical protein
MKTVEEFELRVQRLTHKDCEYELNHEEVFSAEVINPVPSILQRALLTP